MPLLSRDEYLATFGQTRSRASVDDQPAFDFWPYLDDFPEPWREYVATMRLLVEHPAAEAVAAGLDAVPFNCFGFGLFPPGRVGDPESPCLSLWYDDPHPLYWVHLRRRWDRDILTCDQ